MNKFLLSLAAVSAVSAAALPAAAQEWRQDRSPIAYGEPYGRDARYEDRRGHDWRPETNWRDGDRRDGSGLRDIDVRQARIEARIERGARRGALTPRETWRLRSESREIARIEARYRYDGISRWEYVDLSRRLDGLEARVFDARHDGDRYGAGYYR